MLAVLRHPTYAKLFSAQIIALVGTGLLTVALGLLAFDLAGDEAGMVLGMAMTVKMVAYVGVAPVAAALVARLPPRPVLIAADVVRAAVALALPWVAETWQIYFLIFVLQSASATFTPTFQAVIPSVLPAESDYTRALSLSRLAYDLEALVSPLLAAALLTVVGYHHLFMGTVIGFLISGLMVLWARFPHIEIPPSTNFFDRLTRGGRIFWACAELRGLMGLNLVVATTTAMVLVNTVVLVQGQLGRSQTDVALLLGAYGTGSMLVALGMPKLLEKHSDRAVMLTGGVTLPTVLVAGSIIMTWLPTTTQWIALWCTWAALGAATSMILTPSARLLQRNSTEATRPAVFAAQFSLSHACFLLTYPLAGTLGVTLGLPLTGLLLAVVGILGTVVTILVWRKRHPSGKLSLFDYRAPDQTARWHRAKRS